MHAWFDISAGVAGDMLLGSLVDAGADVAGIQAAVDAVVPGSVRLSTGPVVRGGQRGTKLLVRVLVDDPPHRSWATIRGLLDEAELAEQTRTWAQATFELLARAEGRTHGVDPETVHFHEVGALDSIADVVGVCEGLRLLGVTSVSASPVRVGSGRVRAAHGDIPVPVPAVAALVLGWQVYATPEVGEPDSVVDPHSVVEPVEIHHHHHHHDTPAAVTTPGSVGELATPTGMALVRALAGERCEPLPAMTARALGVGAGGKDFAGWPNVVRVVVGEPSVQADRPALDLVELRANVDDLDPRLWPGVLDALFAAGAVDAWLVPIQMKKGRPAFTLHALAEADARDAVADAVLTHTTTLGVRWSPVARAVLDRSWVPVEVLGQTIRVKVGSRGGVVLHAMPEFEDVAEAARVLGLPEADVLGRAQAAASGLVPGGHAPEPCQPDS